MIISFSNTVSAAEKRAPHDSPLRRLATGWITLVVAFALTMRFPGTMLRSLWFDEAFSWRMASFSPTEIVARSAADNNPPLYYVTLKLWMAVAGESALALRLLSIAAGMATCLGAYCLVRDAYGGERSNWLALLAAVLIAVSTYQIRWAWEARMYTLGAALAVWSSWLLVRALISHEICCGRCAPTSHEARYGDGALNPHEAGYAWWTFYALAALAFLYTHSYAAFSIAAQWIFAAGWLIARGPKRALRGALLAAAVVAVGWAPWAAVMLKQAAHVKQSFWSQPLERWDLPHLCYQLLAEPENPRVTHAASAAAAAVCAAVVLQLLWRPCAGDWLVFLMSLAPLAGGLLASLAVTNVVHPRYLFFAHVFWLIALARLLARIPRQPERTIVAGVVLANMLIVHAVFWRRLEIGNCSGVRAAAAYIGERRQGHAPVLVASPFYFTPILYHLADRENCFLVDGGKGFVHYQGTAALKASDFFRAQRLGSLPPGQVWVVNHRSGGGWRNSEVAVPNGWARIDKRVFREPYDVQGTVEVVEYQAKTIEE